MQRLVVKSKKIKNIKCIILVLFSLALSHCANDELNVRKNISDEVIFAKFDPEKKVLPKPNDILRNEQTGQIEIPSEPDDLLDKNALEIEIIKALNKRNGWPRRLDGEIEFSGALKASSINEDSLKIFRIDNKGRLVKSKAELVGVPAEKPTKIEIKAPADGWIKGSTYVVAAMGGEKGLRGISGELVVADSAFWYLRLKEKLTSPENIQSLPGDTLKEKTDKAEQLEEIRKNLAPYFEKLESDGYDRMNIAHLWRFTVSEAAELYMDKDAGKMPLPSNFLIDPSTGLVDIPITDEYSEFEKENLSAVNQLDGFGLTSNMRFEVNEEIDPATLSNESVKVFAIKGDKATQIEMKFRTKEAHHIVIMDTADQIPLEPDTQHVIVITDKLKDIAGGSIESQMAGILAMAKAKVFENGKSNLDSLENESAAKVELVRSTLSDSLKVLKADGMIQEDEIKVAWTFKTMDMLGEMKKYRDSAELNNIDPNPSELVKKTVGETIWEFPLGIVSMWNVGAVYDGEITVTDYLDPKTRGFYESKNFNKRKVKFTMTIPRNIPKGQKLKTVIFGHAIVTERRFVYAVADSLAQKGIAAISIDMPYHGERTVCSMSGPLCVPSILDENGEMWCPSPCESGYTCNDEGRCVDDFGEGNALNKWPVIPFYQTSGSVFLDMERFSTIRDHFFQAISDYSTLLRSLRKGDWKKAIGHEIDPKIGFVGQSLGGIVGSVFVGANPTINNAVLNVPGSSLVTMFKESGWFKGHYEHFLEKRNLEKGTDKLDNLLNIASWLLDGIDPVNYGAFLKNKSFDDPSKSLDREVIIQMAKDDGVIPNKTTELLSKVSGVKISEYWGSHGFLVIPLEPSYLPGVSEMSQTLDY